MIFQACIHGDKKDLFRVKCFFSDGLFQKSWRDREMNLMRIMEVCAPPADIAVRRAWYDRVDGEPALIVLLESEKAVDAWILSLLEVFGKLGGNLSLKCVEDCHKEKE